MPDPISGSILAVGGLGAGASLLGSKASSDAANRGIDLQRDMFNIGRAGQQPFIDAGTNMLPLLTKLLTPGASQTDTLAQLPGFQFASEWGNRGVQANANIRGRGGNMLAEGAKFATGLAQQNFFPLVEQIQRMAGMGAQAAGGVSNAATQTGAGMAQGARAAGDATAAGIMGAGNSISNAVGGYGNMMLLDKLMGGKLFGGSGTGGDIYGGRGGMASAGA